MAYHTNGVVSACRGTVYQKRYMNRLAGHKPVWNSAAALSIGLGCAPSNNQFYFGLGDGVTTAHRGVIGGMSDRTTDIVGNSVRPFFVFLLKFSFFRCCSGACQHASRRKCMLVVSKLAEGPSTEFIQHMIQTTKPPSLTGGE